MSRNLADLDPKLREKTERFLQRMKEHGHPMIVTCSWRKPDEQEVLYAQGRSLPGKRVTNARCWQSKHCMTRIVEGKEQPGSWAVDVAFKGSKPYEGPWELVGQVAKEVGLIWGGNFKTIVDKPHMELPGPIPAWFVRARGGEKA